MCLSFDLPPLIRQCDGLFDFGLSLHLCLRDFRPYLEEYVELAKPNFQYEKRQKELAKKKKQEEKRLKKLAAKAGAEPDPAAVQPPEADGTKSGA